MVEMKMEN